MTLTRTYVQEIFQPLSQPDWMKFLEMVEDEVVWRFCNWEVESMALSGEYVGKQAFLKGASQVFGAFAAPIPLVIQRITISLDENIAIVEFRGEGRGSKDNREFINFFCYVCEFSDAEQPKIKVVTEYTDSALTKQFMNNNL
ncbi:hypothetical protein I302_104519 [Kwoniella bestiolae CBS 10118]|uniref:SnoaL-like domain-containing protein n=1 Tax=Kwoniella bestiolae CBS 10118 TaxID=1296100 RepID=A0A1B9GBH0_9TREE|nr:hypothetical protein I302_03225 [Kwoniella bestiolae CBS 10118]OCF28366.1 hypothetical protein I302_03225 [Kwoniella bestiolae CBS 10118]